MFTVAELREIAEATSRTHPDIADRARKLIKTAEFEGHVYIDIPDRNTIGDDDNAWVNVADAKSVKEAVAWVNENIGGCDELGNVNLLTLGDAKKKRKGKKSDGS